MVYATKRTFALLFAVALMLTLVPNMVGTSEASARDRTADEQQVEKKLFELHNQARVNPGAFGYGSLDPQEKFRWAPDVADVARAWSDEMARTSDFKHNPNYTSETCCWATIGENIIWTSNYPWYGTRDELSQVLMQSWMDSEGHRRNIMNERFTQVGIGATLTSDNRAYVTTVFRRPTADAPASTTHYTSGAAEQEEPKEEEPKVESPKVRGTDNSCPDGKIESAGFTDVSGSQVGPVNCLAHWDITKGTSPTTYSPYGSVTRAQMASFMVRAMEKSGADLPTPTRHHFPDVSVNSTHANDINILAEAGIISGYANGNYGPRNAVERGHMAKFLAESYEYTTGKNLDAPSRKWFTDTNGYILEDNINQIADAGWAGGYGDGTYGHRRDVRRDHMAYFLTRWMDTMVAEGHAPKP